MYKHIQLNFTHQLFLYVYMHTTLYIHTPLVLQLQLLPGFLGHPTMQAAAAKMAPLEAFSCGFYRL